MAVGRYEGLGFARGGRCWEIKRFVGPKAAANPPTRRSATNAALVHIEMSFGVNFQLLRLLYWAWNKIHLFGVL